MEIIHKNQALKAGSHVDSGVAEDNSTAVEYDPWDPPFPPYDPSAHKSYSEWRKQRNSFVKASRSSNIIIPDRTPQIMNSDFYVLYPRLLPILEKDSAHRFLRLYAESRDRISRGYIIIPEVLNQMIVEDALQCAKVVLEGKAPVLEGFRANPNCMNQYGYFPLHEAAERFSVDMIKLLLHHGALTNLRTAGDLVIEDLLPLHVAVEDTCLHKYLEDNLLHNQEHSNHPTKKDSNYVYKIIYLLCLPEMKIFLDTTRLLAEHTDNLVEEIWNYIKDGKLLQTAVLLLAAQGHIRAIDGFSVIITRLAEQSTAIRPITLETSQDEKEKLDLWAKCEHLSSALSLVQIIDKAGKALDSCVQTHQEVPQTKVVEQVSQILKGHGFFHTGGVIRFGNLCPYEWSPMPNRELPKKHGKTVRTEAAAETPHLYRAYKSARRMERKCTWNDFFPYWRSVLAYRYPFKLYPAHAQDDVLRLPNLDQIHNSGSKSFAKPPVPNDKPCSLPRRIPQVTSMHQSRRLFGTVALTILKALKNV